MRILVVEDEPKVAEPLRSGLAAEGHDVVIAGDGEEGFFQLSRSRFDVVILDRMLPGREGLEILRAARAGGVRTPVLVLTAKDAVADRVLGLESGADDYLVKPFHFAELHARVRALVRRGREEPALLLGCADLELDLITRRARRGGDDLALTPRELDLLEYLLRHAGAVVTRAMLTRDVWRETRRATPIDNVIDVHVSRLRRKLDDGREPRLLHTLRGVGFVLREEAP